MLFSTDIFRRCMAVEDEDHNKRSIVGRRTSHLAAEHAGIKLPPDGSGTGQQKQNLVLKHPSKNSRHNDDRLCAQQEALLEANQNEISQLRTSDRGGDKQHQPLHEQPNAPPDRGSGRAHARGAPASISDLHQLQQSQSHSPSDANMRAAAIQQTPDVDSEFWRPYAAKRSE